MSAPSRGKARDVTSYAIGYVIALTLTGGAFALIRWPIIASGATLGLVLGLGVVQMSIHFRFFLQITSAKSSRADLQLILFSTLIIALMVSGTLVILFNLRDRMM